MLLPICDACQRTMVAEKRDAGSARHAPAPFLQSTVSTFAPAPERHLTWTVLSSGTPTSTRTRSRRTDKSQMAKAKSRADRGQEEGCEHGGVLDNGRFTTFDPGTWADRHGISVFCFVSFLPLNQRGSPACSKRSSTEVLWLVEVVLIPSAHPAEQWFVLALAIFDEQLVSIFLPCAACLGVTP